MIPSIKTIMKLGCEREIAHKIRKLMEGNLNPVDVSEKTRAWVRQCHNVPSRTELVMCAIDDLLGTHGVEAIQKQGDYHKPAYTYCNTGDSYCLTVVRDYDKGRYLITSWGDLAEKRDDLV